jgi:molybdate transport system substrate-binding protein
LIPGAAKSVRTIAVVAFATAGLALALLAGGCAPSGAASPSGSGAMGGSLTISAASDLALALEEIVPLFEQETGIGVSVNLGSTGQLVQQIAAGAPVDLLLAADAQSVDELEREQLVVPGTRRVYGTGRLVLWTRSDADLHPKVLQDLLDPRVRRVAIANPDHAPYGRAARQALESLGLWEQVRPKLVTAEGVRQALQYGESGNADVSLAALSLTRGSGGEWQLIPAELHRPLQQTLVVIADTDREQEARAFASFLLEGKGREVLDVYGFFLSGAE